MANTTLTGRPMKLQDGTWGVRLDEEFDGATWAMTLHYVGRQVLVTTRAGKQWTIEVGSVPLRSYNHAVVSKVNDWAALRVAEQMKAKHGAEVKAVKAETKKARRVTAEEYIEQAQPARDYRAGLSVPMDGSETERLAADATRAALDAVTDDQKAAWREKWAAEREEKAQGADARWQAYLAGQERAGDERLQAAAEEAVKRGWADTPEDAIARHDLTPLMPDPLVDTAQAMAEQYEMRYGRTVEEAAAARGR